MPANDCGHKHQAPNGKRSHFENAGSIPCPAQTGDPMNEDSSRVGGCRQTLVSAGQNNDTMAKVNERFCDCFRSSCCAAPNGRIFIINEQNAHQPRTATGTLPED